MSGVAASREEVMKGGVDLQEQARGCQHSCKQANHSLDL